MANHREHREHRGKIDFGSAFSVFSAVNSSFLLVSLFLIILTLLFFYPLAFTDHILARGDTYAYHYPYWAARNAALTAGRLPLWSPDLFMGVPLLANPQIGTFYPPNWLVAPLSPPQGIRVSILLHIAWAGIGTYLLARRALKLTSPAAFGAAAVFAFGGYFGAHIEQINQLQGLAWLPWLVLILDWAVERPPRRAAVLGVALALQFLTGHTQTVFMSLVALGVYGSLTRPLRALIVLALGGGIALVLSAPQLIPTLGLMEVSNRRGGFNLNQATAFSLNPFIIGRGLLPAYDGMIFSEYIGYIGVIGLALAIFGIEKKKSTPENAERKVNKSPLLTALRLNIKNPFLSRFSVVNPFFILALLGVFLALGEFNPLYWWLAGLPGFNLFRVPARWLALFALGAALLAGRGLQRWLDGERPAWIAAGIVIGGLALSTLLTGRMDDGTPAPPPTFISVIGWIVAGIGLVVGAWLGRVGTPFVASANQTDAPLRVPSDSGRSVFSSVLSPQSSVLLFLLLELFLAGRVLPANHLVPPEAFESRRFTVSQLLALNEGQNPPGRVLSISDGLFDPGDRATLEARWFDLSPEARHNAFITVKQRELLAPNLPLLYGIPSIDGFDGGLLPTAYYTAFTSLLLPQGELRSLDGRLRESLASEACHGACIPDQRWLDLTNTRWLVVDKVYDLVHEGIFYDTALPTPLSRYENAPRFFGATVFTTTEIHVVYHCLTDGCGSPSALTALGIIEATADEPVFGNDLHLARYVLESPLSIGGLVIMGEGSADAVTLVDTRTGDFQQLTPEPWRRVLSSDVKLYENLTVDPRAFMVYSVQWTPDTDEGTEMALSRMRERDFSPQIRALLAGEGTDREGTLISPSNTVTFAEYTPERVVIDVQTAADGYLLLTDAYYPGWSATLDGEPTPIYRADVMFRAVFVPAGEHQVTFSYSPFIP